MDIFHQSLDADDVAFYLWVRNIQVEYLPGLAAEQVLVEVFKACRARADLIHIVGCLKRLKSLSVVCGPQVYGHPVFLNGRPCHLLQGAEVPSEPV